MNSIRELLQAGKDVPFNLDGKKGTVKMQPPTAAEARELRDDFYKLGVRVNDAGDNGAANLAAEFEACTAKIVKACFPPDAAESKMTDDEIRLFVLRIGGDKSDVVRYALSVAGIRLGEEDDTAATDSAF